MTARAGELTGGVWQNLTEDFKAPNACLTGWVLYRFCGVGKFEGLEVGRFGRKR
jgi:hypothetical protein